MDHGRPLKWLFEGPKTFSQTFGPKGDLSSSFHFFLNRAAAVGRRACRRCRTGPRAAPCAAGGACRRTAAAPARVLGGREDCVLPVLTGAWHWLEPGLALTATLRQDFGPSVGSHATPELSAGGSNGMPLWLRWDTDRTPLPTIDSTQDVANSSPPPALIIQSLCHGWHRTFIEPLHDQGWRGGSENGWVWAAGPSPPWTGCTTGQPSPGKISTRFG